MKENICLMEGITVQPLMAETARGPIEYTLEGTGGPVVMMVHGGIGGHDQGRVMAAGWVDEREYRILCPSRPGYLGTPLESGPAMEEQADLLAALLDHLGIDKVAIVSASAGGPPGYTFASRHPDRVWAMVAIDCVSGFYELSEKVGPVAEVLFLNSLGQKVTNLLEKVSPASFLRQLFMSEAYFSKKQMSEHIEAAIRDPRQLAFVHAFMQTMFPYHTRKAGTENDVAIFGTYRRLALDAIGCPTLIVHGTHDADVKFYDGVYAHESIRGSERHWIEYGSHLGFWVSPGANAAQEAARAFLEKHRAR